VMIKNSYARACIGMCPEDVLSLADPCEAACLWLGVEDQPQAFAGLLGQG